MIDYAKSPGGLAAGPDDAESQTVPRRSERSTPSDRDGFIAAIGPMGPLEDPDAFDRAMRSYDTQ